MTAKEFYAELAKTERNWRIGEYGGIREGFGLTWSTKLCPITAVCLRVTKKKFAMCEYNAAGETLKLDSSFIKRIVDGSDNPNSLIVRRKLLKAVRL